MYLRFIIRRQDDQSRSWEGLFTAAYNLLDQELTASEREELEALLAWFRMHLQVPPCLHADENQRAICWFKDNADKPIDYARQLRRMVEEHGRAVEMVTTADPGTILYEDRWQIVAKPRRSDRIRP